MFTFILDGPLILVATGWYTNGAAQVIDVTSTNSCQSFPTYPLAVGNAAGGNIGGFPIICGGGISGTYKSKCYIYKQKSNSWKFLVKMTSKRGFHRAARLNGALWVTGGMRLHNQYTTLATTELIYPNGTVVNGPNLPTVRKSHCMVNLHDGRVMILSGNYPISTVKNVIIYDPTSKTFSDAPSLLFERQNAGCALFYSPLHDNRPVVLAVGGSDQDAATTEILDYTHTNSWEQSEYLCHLYFILIQTITINIIFKCHLANSSETRLKMFSAIL